MFQSSLMRDAAQYWDKNLTT